MAERSTLVNPGFRPYQKGLDEHSQPSSFPDQTPASYRVLPNGEIRREQTDLKPSDRHNQQMLSQNRDIRGTRVLPSQHSESKLSQSQTPASYRVLPNGEIRREQTDLKPSDRHNQQMLSQNRDIRGTRVLPSPHSEPQLSQSQKPAVYRVLPDGKTVREQSGQNNTQYKQEPSSVTQNQDGVHLSKTRVFPHGSDIRGTRVMDESHSDPTKGQRHVTYRLRPDGSTYREELDDNKENYQQAPLVPRNGEPDIRATHAIHHAEPIKSLAKEDSIGDNGPASSRRFSSIGESGIHRWAMFRLWVNREISKEVRNEGDFKREFKKRLDLPMDSMVTSVLVDPASDVNGKRLQKRYGSKSAGGQRYYNILPENIYFVFGIPRAKTSIDANVSDFIETMSNAAARSDPDALSTNDALSTKDDAGLTDRNDDVKNVFGKSRGETNNEEKYRRWHAGDLKKSRNVPDGEKGEKHWENKKPNELEIDNFGKSRKWYSDEYNNDSPKQSETNDRRNYQAWDDDNDGDYRKKEKDDIGKSRAEEFTDFAKYHIGDYEKPNKKRRDENTENFSNTKTASENLYATHVNY
ncbi:uncharacterized protein LOC117325943 isoform X2 [Pecten maximus]|uniref:uncharacterized protein LOC117325943 isoform X2 n=1 Tax=Pecten maximus TaxID=6579 RepID=UPI001458122D|nr:uncharacterized protein LOC117325943 isoform X2 [Pecten maximus]